MKLKDINMVRLLEKYQQQVVSQLMNKFSYKNKLSVPKLQKIVVNMGIGRAIENKKLVEEASKHLSVINNEGKKGYSWI